MILGVRPTDGDRAGPCPRWLEHSALSSLFTATLKVRRLSQAQSRGWSVPTATQPVLNQGLHPRQAELSLSPRRLLCWALEGAGGVAL